MHTDLTQLKNFLIDSGLISIKDLNAVIEAVGENEKKVEDTLIAKGLISEDEMRRAKAYVIGIPFVDLRKEKVAKDILVIIPEPIARKHNIVAYKKSGESLEVAMLDPLDLEAIEFIKKGSKLKILPRLTDTESMKAVLLQYQKSLKAEFGDIIQKEAASLKMVTTTEGEEVGEGELKKLAEDLPIVRIVDTLLSHAISQKASDIHIESFEDELIIRYRLDGVLHDAMILPKETAPGITARLKVLANLRLDEKRLPQDGRFKIEADGQNVSFRVSTLPTYYGEKIVMRLLPDSVHGFTLEGVGFHGDGLEHIQEAIRRTTGMILVTGPTGSGKSTTLYALLDILNTPDVNISTIEDPIEYQISRINQTQVKPDIGLTFASGLRTLVRQDPDIIMVGEIRDRETAGLAVNAALTGHLVLSTLHTNSAAGSVPRLLDMGVEPFLLVSTVNIIIAQRLVRRLNDNKEEYFLTDAELKELGKKTDLDKLLLVLQKEKVTQEKDWQKIPFYRPKVSAGESEGKDEDGYSGRVGISEVLPMTRTLRDLIISGATSDAIVEEAKREGMMTIFEDGLYKAARGVTSIEEVLRVITE
ncbi:MAG TPA: GspE/PulE family protein [Candidatus Paceibacterota bacterium]|nr:GspE/PulE family protein [Candidatus Paceibacterota bacterium]